MAVWWSFFILFTRYRGNRTCLTYHICKTIQDRPIHIVTISDEYEVIQKVSFCTILFVLGTGNLERSKQGHISDGLHLENDAGCPDWAVSQKYKISIAPSHINYNHQAPTGRMC